MENEKMQVNFAPGVTEATLRVIELHEENELPVLEPDKVELAGTIGSVYEFLLKRISEKEQINQKRCYILVDREKMTLKLVTNETDSRNKATVRGELKYYPKFLEFGINTSKTWEPVQLSKFFKMNRAFFKDAHHFACLINTCLYQGQEIVKPQDLMLVDPKIQAYTRDVLMLWNGRYGSY